MKKVFVYISAAFGALFLFLAIFFLYSVYRDKNISTIIKKSSITASDQNRSEYTVSGTIKIPPIFQSKVPSAGTMLLTIHDLGGLVTSANILNPKFPYHFEIDLTKNPRYLTSIKGNLAVTAVYPLLLSDSVRAESNIARRKINPLDGSVPLMYLIPVDLIRFDNKLDQCSDLIKKGISGKLKFAQNIPLETKQLTLFAIQDESYPNDYTKDRKSTPSKVLMIGYQNLNPHIAQIQNFHIPISGMKRKSFALVLADCSQFAANYEKCFDGEIKNLGDTDILKYRVISVTGNPVSCNYYQNVKLYLSLNDNDEASLIKFMEEELKDF